MEAPRIAGKSFADDGFVEIDVDGSADATSSPIALALRDDSSLEIVGKKATDESGHPFVAGLSATGGVDVARSFPSVAADYARVGDVASYCREPVARFGEGFAAAGTRGQGVTEFGGAVLMFAPGGDLDPSFDGDGHLAIDEDWVVAVAPLPSGDLLAQLQTTNATPQPPEYVVRITNAGAIDPSFGDGGRSTGSGVGLGLAATAAGETYAGGFEWPDTVYIRRISSGATRSRMRSQ